MSAEGVGVGGGEGGGGDSSSGGCIIDELQDGENSQELEPGELVTPPHQPPQGSASPSLKKILSKDVMNKALRKSMQNDIDNDNDSTEARNVRAILELRRKEMSAQAQHTLENGTAAADNDNDDSEGLYSDTDSSTDEQQDKKMDVEDVQQARKEKQAEAAAAAKAAAPPTAPFIGMSPLRFHMRAPCFDFSRMGFMPRMSRGGMRGMRPSFFSRPQATSRGVTPPPTKATSGSGNSSNGAQGPAVDPGAYGPALPPAQSGQGQDRTSGKQTQSELLWTTCEPPVSFLFHLVNDCDNAEHKDCRQKQEREMTTQIQTQTKETAREKHAKISKDTNKDQREKQREREPAKEKMNSFKEKKLDKSKERSRDRSKDQLREEQRDRSNGEHREMRIKKRIDADRHRGNSRNGGRRRERSKERRVHSKQKQLDKRERSKEKLSVRSRKQRERSDRSREEKTRHRSKDRSAEQVEKSETSVEKQVEQPKQREKQRHRSREKRVEQRERSRERQVEQRERSRQMKRERSKEHTKEKPTERSRDIDTDKNRHKEEKQVPDKPKDHSREKSRHASRERSKDGQRHQERQRERSTSRHNNSISSGKSQSRRSEIRAMTPPAAPPAPPQESSAPAPESLPAALTQDGDVPLELKSEPVQPLTPPRAKAFDIFAESPPRLNKVRKVESSPPPERSTTPPLDKRHVIKSEPITTCSSTSTPETGKLQRHSELHSRIGALLEDDQDELHLEALLATKEQLLRKSHEHRVHKKELHIKQEPIETTRSTVVAPTPAPAARHANPFKRETVLGEATSRRFTEDASRCTASSRRSMQRSNGDRHDGSYSRHSHRERELESRERSIKQEKNRSRTPPLLTARQIKVERDLTPPPREQTSNQKREQVQPSAVAKSDEHSPDTDDYIDNWENDDSMASTPKNAAAAIVARLANGEDEDSNALWNAKSTPPPKAKLQGKREEITGGGGGGTPRVEAKQDGRVEEKGEEEGTEVGGEGAERGEGSPQVADKALINIHDLYDKFMKSIKMGATATTEATTMTSNLDASNATINSSLSNSNSTATEDDEEEEDEDESSSTDSEGSTSSSSSSSDSSDSSDDEDDEDEDGDSSSSSTDDEAGEEQRVNDQEQESQLLSMDSTDQSQQSQSSESASNPVKQSTLNHKKNNVSRDLRKMQSLEDNLARIQMMRENYDSGDEICEELLKMESLFIMQRNAILNKYRKSELKSGEEQLQQQSELEQLEALPRPSPAPAPASPVNNIFNANREAIKLTISPLKLSARKPAIFDKDELETATTTTPSVPKAVQLVKPAKEIAIVKPTIMERARTQKPPPPPPNPLKRSRTRERERSRSRSMSRQRFRRGFRSKDSTRSPSPRRRRHPLGRARFGKGAGMGSRSASRSSGSSRYGLGHGHSQSISRSRTRSRSPPMRRRRLKPPIGGRRRSSSSPPSKISYGPRSPPPPPYGRERCYSRSRSRSRSPLPFKPPSPPMRRSWSTSRSRSRSPGPHSRRRGSRSRSRSRPRSSQSFSDYFVENQSMEAAAYYYNMSLMQQDAMQGQAPGHYMDMSAYMDSAYNMEHAYAQYGEYSTETTAATTGADYDYGAGSGVVDTSSIMPLVLRELPKAPVAVQKGNVLEIVPSMEVSTAETLTIVPAVPAAGPVPEEQVEDTSQPKRKRVNFVDLVLPNYESGSEDRKVVERLMDYKVRVDQRRCAAIASSAQRTQKQLLAVPFPAPPPGAKPGNVDKPVAVQKKPQLRYYHFDPVKALIFRTRERLRRGGGQRQRFDPKYMAMLVKSGRLPMPPFMRHRPSDAMLQEFFTLHPPPPLHHVMPPHYLRGPPPAMTAAVPAATPAATPAAVAPATALSLTPSSQPIPVLGAQSYPCFPLTTASPVPAALPAPLPLPVPLPLPLPLPLPVVLPGTPPLTATPSPSYFTPPPLPTLSSHFKVQPVATMREIMPVDILQKIGPLPKTLDLDVGNPGLDEPPANDDLTDVAPAPAAVLDKVETPPPLQEQHVEA